MFKKNKNKQKSCSLKETITELEDSIEIFRSRLYHHYYSDWRRTGHLK